MDEDKTKNEELPKISIVVPIRNEARFIANTLNQILGQDYPHDKLEVLVVIGKSHDNTVEIVSEIARRDSRVKVMDNPESLASAARTIGSQNATGDIVTFIDGHVYIDNDKLLMNVARLLKEKDVSVLSRPQFLETPENTTFQQAVALARKSIIGHGLDSTIYSDEDKYVDPTSSGATYKKEIFTKVGYFDTRFDACEDVDFNYRVAQAGFRAFTSKALVVYYYPRRTISSLFVQMARYGTGRFRLLRKHPATLSPATLIPALFTISLIVLGLLSLFSGASRSLLSLILFPYLIIVTLWSLYISLNHGLKYLPLLLPIFPTIHIGLGWGYIREAFRTATGKGIDFSA